MSPVDSTSAYPANHHSSPSLSPIMPPSEPLPKPDDKEPRLIVVSNRLPVTISKDDNGEYTFKMSSGGLVSALSGCKKTMSFTWIGWPGKDIPLQDREYVNQRLLEEYQCLPVYLPDDVADRHYNGFSNSILWPLFHYHPGEMNFDASHWLAYREANIRFADVVADFVRTGDVVWVQDYHLMLLPMLLRSIISGESAQGEMTRREMGRVKDGVDDAVVQNVGMQKGVVHGLDEGVEMLEDVEEDGGEVTTTGGGRGVLPGISAFQKQEIRARQRGKGNIRIGFFLHTPFPSSEIYRILPVRREILLGVLQCDLIGYVGTLQLNADASTRTTTLATSCRPALEFLGLETQPNGIEFEGRYAQVGTFPIGIDPWQFVEGLKNSTVQKRLSQLERRFDECRVIIGVDRLDYIKGIPQKLHALEVFLTQHPEWIGKVVLIQLAIPSRQDVEEYMNLRSCVNELVGRINGQFSTPTWSPIIFMHRSVPVEELTAMYALADVCLVTSTRDGMNLVAYEYISTQAEKHGSMILSEFAGASQSLAGSLIINPWDVDSTASAIHTALTLSPETRAQNWTKLFAYVSNFTAQSWGLSFLNELNRSTGRPPAGPLLGGRRKSGSSLSRTSSKASMKRRFTVGNSIPPTPIEAPRS